MFELCGCLCDSEFQFFGCWFFYSWHKSDYWSEFFKIFLFFVPSLFLVENQIHTVVPEWYMGHHFSFSGTILNDKKVVPKGNRGPIGDTLRVYHVWS